MGGETLFQSGDSGRDSGVSRLARVAVERGIDRLDADPAFTYLAPDEGVGVGRVVEVPLGRKHARGVVVDVGGPELLDHLRTAEIKPIARVGRTSLPVALVELARWMSDYYVCPLGMVLASMLPAAVKKDVGVRRVDLFSPSPTPTPDPSLRKPGRALWERVLALDPGVFPCTLKDLARALELRATGQLRTLVSAGLLASTPESRVEARTPLGFLATPGAPRPTPSDDQRAVIEGIGSCLGAFGVHLLRGVTGSGKTEVYLSLIDRVLAGPGSAIVLVPEIALTPQATQRFVTRFGPGAVAVLHSGLTEAQRNREWTRAATGGARVVVGARSGVFAPVPSLALIVVDEEHDPSYKQDRLPRYNARDVAIKRAQLAGACVILGSATPSIESWKRAKEPGGYRLWELPRRVAGATLPRVEIADLRDERRLRIQRDGFDDSRQHALGPTLEGALESTLADGGPAILLLNRRGFAHALSCRNSSCAWQRACDQCDALLVLHRPKGVPSGSLVRCHHCLAEQLVPKLCPLCAGALTTFGCGTQRAEEELVRKFGSMGLEIGTTLLRIDSDSMRSASDYFHALDRFAKGEARVLLGTQMIAKGLDYPNVRLVGVLDADTSLSLPDFRAAERTFQLVSQVAGRAGRASEPGRVIIQTRQPNHPAIRLAAAHDFVTFADAELAIRQRSSLPPASRMAWIVCRDPDAAKARAAATRLAEALRDAATVVVRGPAECLVSRIAGHYRFGIEITGARAGNVQAALRAARRAGLLKSDRRTAVDVDPVVVL